MFLFCHSTHFSFPITKLRRRSAAAAGKTGSLSVAPIFLARGPKEAHFFRPKERVRPTGGCNSFCCQSSRRQKKSVAVLTNAQTLEIFSFCAIFLCFSPCTHFGRKEGRKRIGPPPSPLLQSSFFRLPSPGAKPSPILSPSGVQSRAGHWLPDKKEVE